MGELVYTYITTKGMGVVCGCYLRKIYFTDVSDEKDAAHPKIKCCHCLLNLRLIQSFFMFSCITIRETFPSNKYCLLSKDTFMTVLYILFTFEAPVLIHYNCMKKSDLYIFFQRFSFVKKSIWVLNSKHDDNFPFWANFSFKLFSPSKLMTEFDTIDSTTSCSCILFLLYATNKVFVSNSVTQSAKQFISTIRRYVTWRHLQCKNRCDSSVVSKHRTHTGLSSVIRFR